MPTKKVEIAITEKKLSNSRIFFQFGQKIIVVIIQVNNANTTDDNMNLLQFMIGILWTAKIVNAPEKPKIIMKFLGSFNGT